MKNTILIAALASSCILMSFGCGDNTPANSGAAATKADNTAQNKVDRDHELKTPTDQGENSADIKITADIRRAVMDDKSLSTNAQNVKIVTSKGVVTLRGVVDTAAEKASVESKAKAIAGVTNVDNQTEVKNP